MNISRVNSICRIRPNKKKIQEKNRKCVDHKCNALPKKTNYGGIRSKSFIHPEVLRRQRNEETRVYGENACQALFKNRPNCIIRAWFIQSVMSRFKELLQWMVANRKAYHVVDDVELTKVSGTKHHGGICFLIKKRNGITVQQWVSQENIDDCCILALEYVSNPHNLGAIMRSCAHFGVKGILIQNSSLLESGAAIRTAEGGAEYVQPIAYDSIISALKKFRKIGYTVVTASSHASLSLFKVSLPSKMLLVLGQEKYGLSSIILSLADLNVSIYGTDNIESLNVSVATGIFLGEWWRQNKV